MLQYRLLDQFPQVITFCDYDEFRLETVSHSHTFSVDKP